MAETIHYCSACGKLLDGWGVKCACDDAFPPASAVDVFFYSDDEIVAGYRDYRPGDP